MKILKNNISLLLGVLIFILLMVLFVNSSNAQHFTVRPSSTIRNVQKEQAYYSFDRWRKEQPKVRKRQIKYAVQASAKNSKEDKKNQKFNKKIEGIRQKIK